MSVERKIESNNQAREFLSVPFDQVELPVREFTSQPDLEFLQWLPTSKEEAGLVLKEGSWFIIKGYESGIPDWMVLYDSDVFLHSHFVGEDEEDDGSIPSPGDFANCSQRDLRRRENLIVSQKGITQYWPVTTREDRRQLEWALEAEIRGKGFGKGQRQEYLQFLEKVGARFTVYSWEELDDERLAQLLRK